MVNNRQNTNFTHKNLCYVTLYSMRHSNSE